VTVESISTPIEGCLIKHAGDRNFLSSQCISLRQRKSERVRVREWEREREREREREKENGKEGKLSGARDYRVSHGNETIRRGSRKSLARDLSSFIRPPARSCQRSDAHGKLCQKYGPSTYLPTYIRARILSGCLHRYMAIVVVLEMVAIFARSWQEDNEIRPDTRYTTTLSWFSPMSLLLSLCFVLTLSILSILYHPRFTLQLLLFSSLCSLYA